MKNFKSVFNNHRGYAQRITRRELCKLTGASDRVCRKEIELLRKSGVPIISNSKSVGYWLYDPDSAEDREQYGIMVGELKNRLKNISQVLNAVRNEVEYSNTDIKPLPLFDLMEVS